MKKYISSEKLKIINALNLKINNDRLEVGNICTFNSNFDLKINNAYKWFYFTGYFWIMDDIETSSYFENYGNNFLFISPIFYIYDKKIKYFKTITPISDSYCIVANLNYDDRYFYPKYLLSSIDLDIVRQIFSGKRKSIENIYFDHFRNNNSNELLDFENNFLSFYNKMFGNVISYCVKNEFLMEVDDEKI